jgi:hypothetical protein
MLLFVHEKSSLLSCHLHDYYSLRLINSGIGRPVCNSELINVAGEIFALTESELSNIIAQR